MASLAQSVLTFTRPPRTHSAINALYIDEPEKAFYAQGALVRFYPLNALAIPWKVLNTWDAWWRKSLCLSRQNLQFWSQDKATVELRNYDCSVTAILFRSFIAWASLMAIACTPGCLQLDSTATAHRISPHVCSCCGGGRGVYPSLRPSCDSAVCFLSEFGSHCPFY